MSHCVDNGFHRLWMFTKSAASSKSYQLRRNLTIKFLNNPISCANGKTWAESSLWIKLVRGMNVLLHRWLVERGSSRKRGWTSCRWQAVRIKQYSRFEDSSVAMDLPECLNTELDETGENCTSLRSPELNITR